MQHQLPVIGHVLHRLHLAGAEVLAADLSRRLCERYRFVFLCLDAIGPLGEELAREGFAVLDLRRRPGVDLPAARRLARASRQYDIDLLHTHQYSPFFYAAASRWPGTRPRILFTEHGRHYPDCRRPKRVLANRLLLRRRDGVTAVGQFVKQALVANEGIAARRVEVIYNGIDPQRFDVAARLQQRGQVRAELGLPPDAPVALQVARFHPVKDHATMMRAMAQVVRELPGALLLLAGDGPQRAAIEALAGDSGIAANVRFLGVRQDVPRLMAAADAFVLSSLSEGISVTLLEAMGCGLPIAATDVGGNAEVVAHGSSGLLSPRGDAAALAANLLALLRDPQRAAAMGAAGRERLLAQFTQQQMHQRFAELYQQMTG